MCGEHGASEEVPVAEVCPPTPNKECSPPPDKECPPTPYKECSPTPNKECSPTPIYKESVRGCKK